MGKKRATDRTYSNMFQQILCLLLLMLLVVDAIVHGALVVDRGPGQVICVPWLSGCQSCAKHDQHQGGTIRLSRGHAMSRYVKYQRLYAMGLNVYTAMPQEM